MPEAPSALDRHSSDQSDPSPELSDEEFSTLFATDALPWPSRHTGPSSREPISGPAVSHSAQHVHQWLPQGSTSTPFPAHR